MVKMRSCCGPAARICFEVNDVYEKKSLYFYLSWKKARKTNTKYLSTEAILYCKLPTHVVLQICKYVMLPPFDMSRIYPEEIILWLKDSLKFTSDPESAYFISDYRDKNKKQLQYILNKKYLRARKAQAYRKKLHLRSNVNLGHSPSGRGNKKWSKLTKH
jgi:hypothetical protein